MRYRQHAQTQMKLILLPLLFSLLFFFLGCGNTTVINNKKITGYDLINPDKIHTLPDTLREISGVTIIDTATVACIQDENGLLFIYDLSKNEIKKQYAFDINGDYEGIARVGNTIYILRSDGMLFEISDYTAKNFAVHSYQTGIPARNNEGLCYDADSNRLLIACKNTLGKGILYKDKRAIYSFHLPSKKLSETPVFDFHVSDIKTFSKVNNLSFPVKTKKKGSIEPVIKFRPSAIGIHPVTKKLYLLSASDHCLFIFHRNGEIEHIEQLDPVLFNKAEGIAFFSNGNMVITNEAQDKKPTLLQFRYRK